MKRSDPFDMRTPIWFKLWFAFVFFLIVCIVGSVGYVLMQVAKAGPEGIGRQIGAVIKGINDGQK